jgi:hypothetical protein
MAEYHAPIENLPIFDTNQFINPDNENLTLDTAKKYFLRFPNAQGTENLQDTNINGSLNISGSDTNIVNIETSNINASLNLGIVNDIGIRLNQGSLLSGRNYLDGTSCYGDFEFGPVVKNGTNSKVILGSLWSGIHEYYKLGMNFTDYNTHAPLELNYELAGDLPKKLMEFGYNGTKFDSLTFKNTTLKRMNQELSTSSSFENVNGYYSLAKNSAKIPNQQWSVPMLLTNFFDIQFAGSLTGTFNYLGYSTAWSPLLGLYLSSAFQGGGFGNQLRTSPDGINWTNRPYSATTNTGWVCLWCSAPSNKFFVFNASTGPVQSGRKIMSSPDGINWTVVSTPTEWDTVALRSACYSPELNTIVVTGGSNLTPSTSVFYSTDGGITFNNVPDILASPRFGSVWSPELGLFLITSSTNFSYTSPDGINWTQGPGQSFNFFSGVLEWSSELGMFVSATDQINQRIAISYDGINWTSISTTLNVINRLIWIKELCIFVGILSGSLAYSQDGINWFNASSGLSNTSVTLCWSPELSSLVLLYSGATANRGFLSRLNSRLPTQQNVFNSIYNSISNNGDWTYNRILFSGNSGVRIGPSSGLTTQGSQSIAIGTNAADTTQSTDAVSIGTRAGRYSQFPNTVAIGVDAGGGVSGTSANSQQDNAIAIGITAGQLTQGASSIAIGRLCGNTSQNVNCVAIGNAAGQTSQGLRGIAIGSQAGQTSQATDGIAIGRLSGSSSQQQYGIGIGAGAGQTSQGTSGIAIGFSSGGTSQGSNCVSIGNTSGNNTQGASSIAIGNQAAQTTQGTNAVSIGNRAGQNSQGNSAIAIGIDSGGTSQGGSCVSIGTQSGQTSQGTNSVAIGRFTANSSQGNNSVAIGNQSGQTSQRANCVAIGFNAGNDTQGISSIAMGLNAGQTTQGTKSIAIGENAGQDQQGINCIAIGTQAGQTTQANNSIAIGPVISNLHSNTIVLNSAGTGISPTPLPTTQASSFYVNPIRGVAHGIGVGILHYDPSTFEITYSTT